MIMEYLKDDFNWGFKAKKSISVIIVGAGIAGLAASIGTRISSLNPKVLANRFQGLKRAGHNVIILEQASQIREVGAGIQMAPNAARILDRFGLLEKIMDCANVTQASSSRRWQNNKEIGTAPLMPKVQPPEYDTRTDC